MNILITGAKSFIGSYFRAHSSCDVHEVDLLTTKPCDIDFSLYDTVFHVAAIVHQDKGTPDDVYYKVNRDLAYDVAHHAKKNGIKQFVFMSTVKVYGENTLKSNPWTESSVCNPSDAYGKSKLQAENLLLELSDDDFTVSIIRTPVVYGPGVKGNILRMAKFVAANRYVPFGGINNQRAMVYIGNLVALIQEVISQRKAGVSLAMDNCLLSTSEFVEFLILGANKKRVLIFFPLFFQWVIKVIRPHLYMRIFGSMSIDNSRTKEALQFTPPFSEQEGLLEVMKNL